MFVVKKIELPRLQKGGQKYWGYNSEEDTQFIVIHHDGVYAGQEVDPIQRYESDSRYSIANRWYAYSAQYHFMIGVDSSDFIYQGLSIKEKTAHCSNLYYNMHSVAISIQGNYEIQEMTQLQKDKLDFLIEWLKERMPAKEVTWHKETSKTKTYPNGTTVCPGKNIIGYLKETLNKQAVSEEEKKKFQNEIAKILMIGGNPIDYISGGYTTFDDLEKWADSPEKQGILNEIYDAMLHRPKDPEGSKYWKPQDLVSIIRGIKNSKEFKVKSSKF